MNKASYVLIILLAATLSWAYPARVISIVDGDTCRVLTDDNQNIKIRLAGIDSPERKQPFSKQSAKALSEMLLGQTVEVKSHGKDRYGRTVADLYLGSRWINLEMVKNGFAWHYKAYSKDRRLAQAEGVCRKKRIGLWANATPTPPWDFRKVH